MKKVITAIILTALCVNLFGCASSTPEASTTSSNATENVSSSNISTDVDSEGEDEDEDDNNNNTSIKENKEWALKMRATMDGEKRVCFPLENNEMYINSTGINDYGDYSDNQNTVSDNGEYALLVKTWTVESEYHSVKLEEIVDKPKLWEKHISCNAAFAKIMKECNPYNASFVKESEEKVKIGNKECMKYIGTIQLDADKGTFYAECYTFFVDSTPCYILSVMLNDIKTDKGDKAAMEEKLKYIIASAYSQN